LRNAASSDGLSSGEVRLRKPMVGGDGSSARAANGNAAALPRAAMNSRRLIILIRRPCHYASTEISTARRAAWPIPSRRQLRIVCLLGQPDGIPADIAAVIPTKKKADGRYAVGFSLAAAGPTPVPPHSVRSRLGGFG
jgi:hypothetical protein